MEQVQAEVEAELRSKAKSVNIIGFPTCWVKDGQRIFICLMEILLKKTQALYIFFLDTTRPFNKKYRLYQVYQSVTNPLIRPVGTTPWGAWAWWDGNLSGVILQLI